MSYWFFISRDAILVCRPGAVAETDIQFYGVGAGLPAAIAVALIREV